MQKIYPFFLVHSGCRHRCEFCNQLVSSGCEVTCTPEDVRLALSGEFEKKISEVAFYGGSFTLLPYSTQRDYLTAVTQSLRDGLVDGIRISTRPDAIDKRSLDFLREHGVTTIELGCQSFDNSILKDVNRGHTAEDIVNAAALLKEYSFDIGLQVMIGLPNESLSGSARSVRLAIDLSPTFIRLFPTLVLSGSALESRWRGGDYCPLSIENAIDFCADALLYSHIKGVPVARTGLHNTKCMDSNAVLAGPTHPAFGQLVKSTLWKRALRSLVNSDSKHGRELEVFVTESDLSDAIGHGRKNLIELNTEEVSVSISSDILIHRGEFRVGTTQYSMMEVTNYEYPEFWN